MVWHRSIAVDGILSHSSTWLQCYSGGGGDRGLDSVLVLQRGVFESFLCSSSICVYGVQVQGAGQVLSVTTPIQDCDVYGVIWDLLLDRFVVGAAKIPAWQFSMCQQHGGLVSKTRFSQCQPLLIPSALNVTCLSDDDDRHMYPAMGGGDPVACANFLCRKTTAAATFMLPGYQHDHLFTCIQQADGW